MTTAAFEIMTPDQAAELLQVPRATIYRYIRSGALIASRLGRHYRIARADVQALLWATRTRPDIRLREFTDEQIAEFMAEDRLSDGAREIVDALERYDRLTSLDTNGRHRSNPSLS
jgi:excisionase family DNA binding protein